MCVSLRHISDLTLVWVCVPRVCLFRSSARNRVAFVNRHRADYSNLVDKDAFRLLLSQSRQPFSRYLASVFSCRRGYAKIQYLAIVSVLDVREVREDNGSSRTVKCSCCVFTAWSFPTWFRSVFVSMKSLSMSRFDEHCSKVAKKSLTRAALQESCLGIHAEVSCLPPATQINLAAPNKSATTTKVFSTCRLEILWTTSAVSFRRSTYPKPSLQWGIARHMKAILFRPASLLLLARCLWQKSQLYRVVRYAWQMGHGTQYGTSRCLYTTYGFAAMAS